MGSKSCWAEMYNKQQQQQTNSTRDKLHQLNLQVIISI